jgi:hypothetical protein
MWDPSACDPKLCDFVESKLQTLDPELTKFASERSALVKYNYHNVPRRAIFRDDAEGVSRQIEILPADLDGNLPWEDGFWISGSVSFDQDRSRWLHWFSPSLNRKIYGLSDLQQHMREYLEEIWTELGTWDSKKLKRAGGRVYFGK